ncbi:MopE-related protein [Archangium lansingense]|uniref:MopE-related protein n=1 Tax=Archangium lansingense TaxID=2995310 RepID=UPI003B77C899
MLRRKASVWTPLLASAALTACSGTAQQEAAKETGTPTSLATTKQTLQCNIGSMSLSTVPALQRLGSACGSQVGSALAGGDADGDGRSDIVVGAPGGSGAACLVRGNALLDIRTASNKIATGEANARIGSSVLLGNFNSNSKAELLVGGPGFTSDRGALYAVDGNRLPAFVASDVMKYVGGAIGDKTGTALANGDLTGDGVADLAIGAPTSEYNGGSTLSPTDSGIVYVVRNTGVPVVNTNLYGTNANIFRIQNTGTPLISQAELKAGSSLAVADLNGDGTGDLLVGVPGYNDGATTKAGAVFVFYGPLTGNRTLSSANARLVGTSAGAMAGISLARVKDLNGDGKDEVLVGAPGSASAYLVYGGTLSGSINLGTFPSLEGTAGDLAGTSVASDDFDGDGVADLLVGAPGHAGGKGAAYLIYGDQPLMPTQLLSGFTSFEGESAGDEAGKAVASAGDFDGDGVADVLVGAPGYSGGQGQAYLIRGQGPRSWFPDNDGDGHGDATASPHLDCVPPTTGTWVDNGGDCDDANAAVNPDQAELCSTVGVDDNCDGVADDSTASDAQLWFKDADQDKHADVFTPLEQACAAPGPGWVRNDERLGDECWDPAADNDPDSNSSAPEMCDTKDNNCNGEVDEGNGAVWYVDVDRDGYGSDTEFFPFHAPCGAPPRPGYVTNKLDCNDRDASLNPNTPWYLDRDNDGVGNSTDPLVRSCTKPTGSYVRTGNDCNDSDSTVRPGIAEVCEDENGPQKDNNCNGTPDDTLAAPVWFRDNDGDNYGSAVQLGRFCGKPANSSKQTGDCNDNENRSYPGNTESCEIDPSGNRYIYVEQVDNDCDGDVNNAPQSLWWDGDGDRDGFRGTVFGLQRCTNPSDRPGEVKGKYLLPHEPLDCNDSDANATVNKMWYPDTDNDGCGNPNQGVSSCYNPSNVCGGTPYVNLSGPNCT